MKKNEFFLPIVISSEAPKVQARNLIFIFESKNEIPRRSASRNDIEYGFLRSLIPMTLMFLFISCGPKEIQPIELFPEDECASCRMTVSDPAFASEIINKDGSVVKFDDLRCFENYRKYHNIDDVEKIFVKDYETKAWIPFGKSIVIQTGIETPMGSGQIAVADQQRAKQLKERYPPTLAAMEGDACCAPKKN